MSDYKRFVSYIYGYKQGEKGESTGFVKVNARGGECRIWIHMRGFYAHHQEPYRVYAFRQKKDGLEGSYLGELESRNGALEWDGLMETDHLMGGFGLEESRGIYIDGGSRVYAAEWDDYPVDVDRFYEAKPDIRLVVREKEDSEAVSLPVELQTEPDSCGTELHAAALPDPKKEQWEYLLRHFPVMRYQDQNGGVISSIRLGNRDLNRIPRDKWELGNNSFLLHGFYQYKHLLLLRRETEEQIGYYLGVPGVYNEREQMLASMFGFGEFRVIKGQETKDGSFGYWCREL